MSRTRRTARRTPKKPADKPFPKLPATPEQIARAVAITPPDRIRKTRRPI